jgi:hypothetical protein
MLKLQTSRLVPALGAAFLATTVASAAVPTIDVLVLYTPSARSAAGSATAMRAAIEAALSYANLTLGNSRIDARLRLADSREIAYRESPVDILEDVVFMATSREVADLREALGADLVGLVKPTTRPTMSGIGVGMTRQMMGTATAPVAFFVTSLDSFPQNFIHEIGHNLGCNHEPEVEIPPALAAYPYAFAHYEPGVFRTIMDSSTGTCDDCPKIPYFSNPEVSYEGRPTGVRDRRDNARVVGSLAPVVARFGELRGRIGFAVAALSVKEGSRQVEVEVFRTDGSIGPVAVGYATEDGSALAGLDYQPVAGTLTWETGEADVLALRGTFDAHRRRIVIPLLDDPLFEGEETLALVLAAPGGGAALGRERIEIRIRDDDRQAPPPAAPSHLAAAALSTTELELAWADNAVDAIAFHVEGKPLGGVFARLATVGAGTTGAVLGGLAPATGYVVRVQAENRSGLSDYSNEAEASTRAPAGPCVLDESTLCLNGGRFRVRVRWSRDSDGQSGAGRVVPGVSSDDSGLFYFFHPANWEMLIKVLDACQPALGDHYWVFFAATTDVEFVVTVSDSLTGTTRSYHNPPHHPADAVTDTQALPVCSGAAPAVDGG